MPTKDIHLFDRSNQALQVTGIRLELFDAVYGTLLASDNSKLLSSGDWGVQLSFVSSSHPLDIYVNDPSYRYPGNALRSLNGQLSGKVEIDLLKLPPGPGGQAPPSGLVTAGSLSRLVENGIFWNQQEKAATWNLIFNYLNIFVPWLSRIDQLQDLGKVAQNWQSALERLGIDAALLGIGREGIGAGA
ncbi:MAG TPA: hypothetical protein VHQ90_03370 [Thermoanaerobaculia bacterium]|nr:hypothetical protein [Thermoanaerobaculia bacterium]